MLSRTITSVGAPEVPYEGCEISLNTVDASELQ